MRVAIIGDKTPPLDEGMKKTTAALSEALEACCEVRVYNPLQAATLGFWQSLRAFKPDIVHYIPGPSLKSFVLLRSIKRWAHAPAVLSATHPVLHLPLRLIDRFFRPDLLLVQSGRTQAQFHALHCRVDHLPNGVDTRRFHPASLRGKQAFREKYAVRADAYVALHVGNTRSIRNLDCLVQLQNAHSQVVVVGSTSLQGDRGVADRLRRAGCMLLDRFIEPIEELYALADCYVFPLTNPVGAIELPLSVLEAMACNLPVVARRFGAIPDCFPAGEGLYLVETEADLVAKALEIRAGKHLVANRQKVMPYDWEIIASRLYRLYAEILD